MIDAFVRHYSSPTKKRTKVVVFPNAKINLGLHVVSRRADGFHDLESCFVPLPYTDVLEIVVADKFSFSSSGIAIPGQAEENLCVKAYRLMQKDFNLPPVQIHLHKVIPIGAGLGGGSSDASFTLKALSSLFELFLDDFLLEEYAARLGSDCPFFIENRARMAYGTGNEFADLQLDLSGKYLLLVTPPVHVSTAEAYAGITPAKPAFRLKDVLEKKPVSEWKNKVSNDFEKSVFARYPLIAGIKDLLYEAGALYASMSGSGAAVYGLFDQPLTKPDQLFPEDHVIWQNEQPLTPRPSDR
jgi:4-diphosphocytidyl-2-C-methyl-D-erythritol kinase